MKHESTWKHETQAQHFKAHLNNKEIKTIEHEIIRTFKTYEPIKNANTKQKTSKPPRTKTSKVQPATNKQTKYWKYIHMFTYIYIYAYTVDLTIKETCDKDWESDCPKFLVKIPD